MNSLSAGEQGQKGDREVCARGIISRHNAAPRSCGNLNTGSHLRHAAYLRQRRVRRGPLVHGAAELAIRRAALGAFRDVAGVAGHDHAAAGHGGPRRRVRQGPPSRVGGLVCVSRRGRGGHLLAASHGGGGRGGGRRWRERIARPNQRRIESPRSSVLSSWALRIRTLSEQYCLEVGSWTVWRRITRWSGGGTESAWRRARPPWAASS